MNVSHETLEDRKNTYFDLLQKWNKTHNLVQSNSLDDFLCRHWEDSLQLTKYIPLLNLRIFDIGSGAGFPGIPLACAGYNVTLCEIISKKVAFLKTAKSALGLDFKIIDSDAYKIHETFDIITSRAFSALENILEIMMNVSHETSKGLFLKGKTFEEEVKKARDKFVFDLNIYPSQTSLEGVVLEITNLKKK